MEKVSSRIKVIESVIKQSLNIKKHRMKEAQAFEQGIHPDINKMLDSYK